MAPGYARQPLASSASSSGSERSSPPRSSSRSGGSGSSKRSVGISDRVLTELAVGTERQIHWGNILRNSVDEAGNKQWKWLDNMGQFSLYSKNDPGRYAVMASGVLSCSVPEVVHLLHAPHAEQFLQSMEGLYGEDFKDGAFVHRVNLRALEEDGVYKNTDLLDLSVKSALFGNDHKWSFIEAAYRRLDGEGFEKLMTTLDPRDVEGAQLSETSQSHKNHLQNVTAAFTVQPEVASRDRAASENHPTRARPWKETRVFFYAEVVAPPAQPAMHKQLTRTSSTGSATSAATSAPFDKAVKQRLLTMARSCERLTELVRRRRLGLHEIPERKTSSIFSTTPSRCLCCNKSLMLLGVKHCKLCAQTVCTECSRKHERETYTHGSQRVLVEDVRVCDRCMDLVDRAELPELDDHSLLAPAIKLAATKPPKPQTSLLTELLNSELLQADSDARKASVMSVIKSVLEQEQQQQQHHHASMPPPSYQGRSTRGHASSRGGIVLMPPTPDHSASVARATEAMGKASIH